MMPAMLGLVVGVLLSLPLAATAQSRVGVLSFTDSDSFRQSFAQALRKEGYVEGKEVLIEWRSAAADRARAAKQAKDLVERKMDVIVARLTPAVHAARDATTSIPIVMAGAGDPLGTGLVASLARPGGNVTGIAGLAAEVSGKRIEILQEMLPGIRRIGLLVNTDDPFAQSFIRESEAAAAKLGVRLEIVDVRRPNDMADAYRALKKTRAEAVIVQGILVDSAWRAAPLALEHRLPALSFVRPFAERGGLANLTNNQTEIAERAASFVARILKGARPGDLPVEQPTRLELTVNLKTAKALGLTLPRSLLLRADQVIE